MNLDVIVATYNRERLLRRTLESLRCAPVPPGMSVTVTVVDNNSRDSTTEVVREFQSRFGAGLKYLFEPRQGKSHALNRAISSTTGELVAFIDDDEQIGSRWYFTIRSVFEDPAVDYAGGKTLPDWSQPPPDWLPPAYRAVVGWVEGGDQIREFGADYEGILMGGNAVLRRRALNRLGTSPYSNCVGRSGKRLLTADDDFFLRLLETGARGRYVPSLVVCHHVSPNMMTKRYHRRWCFWNFVSQARLDRQGHAGVPFLLGAPRWYYRQALAGLVDWLRSLAGLTQPAKGMTGQLNLIRLLGFLYGRHVYWR